MKKILIATAVLAMVATPIAASAQPFVRDGRAADFDPRAYRYGGYGGAAVAAGLFGLVLGTAIADSQPVYAYAPPYPVVRCGWETRVYPGPYGTVTYQQVQVCR